MNSTEPKKARASLPRASSTGKTRPKVRKPAKSGKPADFADIAKPGESLFDRRERLIDRHLKPTDPRWRMAHAMCTLDRSTDPAELLARSKGDCGPILEMTRYLAFRTLQRASWTLVELEFEPDRRLDAEHEAGAIATEKLLREALLTSFPSQVRGGRRLDLAFFEATFAHYTVGAIRMASIARLRDEDPLFTHGQPDGANYFSFAECALLFLRLGLEPKFWERLLPAFVAGASYFADIYWLGNKRRASDYKPTKETIVVNPAAMLSAIRQLRLANISQMASRFDLVVAMALADDPAISFPSPSRKEFQ